MDFEKRLCEWVKWYEEHKNDASDLKKRVDFLETAVKGCYELFYLSALSLRDVKAENSVILMPKSLAAEKGIRG